ncbi:MAG: glycosyltransferase family 2 protein [Gemmatimonadaceae bacterium]|nr:glycosyltransferase family 2 protein [Gemmatimonadaceae bacterium]
MSASVPHAPLLTVCIPCYNGAAYLGVVLEALLPQAAAAGKEVEILVVDDGSTDDTTDVVNSATRHGPFRYIRNDINLGMSKNIVSAMRHASGEYVWVMSQHNVFFPGALARVLSALRSHSGIDAFYVNFRAANYPDQWPAAAVGGYAGAFHYLCKPDLANRLLDRWEEVLDARTCVATQTYAHIIRRRLATEFWKHHQIGRDFSNALDTYSQTCTVANIMFGRPAVYIGQPVMTIYNGAQTWGSLRLQAKVYLQSHPDLLDLFARLGWSGDRLAEAQALNGSRARTVIAQLLSEWRGQEVRLVPKYLLRYAHQRGTAPAVWKALLDSRAPGLLLIGERSARAADAAFQYLFHNWRPARWIRARGKSAPPRP